MLLPPSCRLWRVLVYFYSILSLAGCSPPTATTPAAIRIRWAHDPESLDPLRMASPQAIEAFNLLHVGLLQLNYASRRFEPALAAALPEVRRVGDSLTLLAYQLRPQATWDDGRPVLARDVAFSVKLMFCPGLPNEAAQARYSFIQDVQLDPADSRRLTFVCRGQAPDYVQATGSFVVLPEAAFDPAGQLRSLSLAALRRPAGSKAASGVQEVVQRYLRLDPSQHPERLPGSGPYVLTTWLKDHALTFRRKTNWWADRLPPPIPAVLQAQPTQLRYEIVPGEAAATLALQRGELDLFPQMAARDFTRLRQSTTAQRSLVFYTTSSYDIVTAGFNTRRPALADALTRRALSRLFDADGLLAATQLGAGQRTAGLISPTDKANYNDSLALTPYDLPGAEALLRQAGWRRDHAGWTRLSPGTGQQTLRLMLRYRPDESVYETIALQFRAAAGRLGIPVELQPTESGALTGVLKAGEYDVYLRTLRGNPFGFNFAPILHSRAVGEGNLTGFGTPVTDRLIEAVAAAENPVRQARLLRRFQAMLQAQCPIVPLFFLPTRLAVSRRLVGLAVYDLKPGYVATTLRPTAGGVGAVTAP